MSFSVSLWCMLAVAVCSYLIGNVNTAITISKLLKRDIRKEGSGNPGTMNMSRVFGLKIGRLILVLDIVKGVIPTLIAKLAFSGMLFENTVFPISNLAQYLAGFCVVLGHIFPVFYGFKGGKGIASTIGVFFVTEWYLALIFGIVALAFIFITRIGSMGSFLATTPPAIFACISVYNTYYVPSNQDGFALTYVIIVNLLILGVVFLTWFAHRTNIEKLLAGEEHSTDWLQMIKDIPLKKKLKEKINLSDTAKKEENLDNKGEIKNDENEPKVGL